MTYLWILITSLLITVSCAKPSSNTLYTCDNYPSIQYLNIVYAGTVYKRFSYMTFDQIYDDLSNRMKPSKYQCSRQSGGLFCKNDNAVFHKYLMIRAYESHYIQASTNNESAVDDLSSAIDLVVKKLH